MGPMDHFVIWRMRGVVYVCIRNPNDWYMLDRIARIDNRS